MRLQVLQLAACVFDARLAQALGVVLVAREDLDDGGGQRGGTGEDHAGDLLLAHERHDARRDGDGDARRVGELEEAVEVVVVEKQLRDEKARARILLLLEVLD